MLLLYHATRWDSNTGPSLHTWPKYWVPSLFVEGHGAAQAGADATGHALLQRDIAGHAPLLRQGCHRFEHGGRAAGHDAIEVLLLAQVRHQAVVAVEPSSVAMKVLAPAAWKSSSKSRRP